MRITLGYKFIFGFLAVVAAVAFVPGLVEGTDVPEWLKMPITVLVAMLIGLILGSIFTRNFTKRFSGLARITKQISIGHESSGEVVAGTGRIFDGALRQARHMEETSKAVSGVKNLANEVAEKV